MCPFALPPANSPSPMNVFRKSNSSQVQRTLTILIVWTLGTYIPAFLTFVFATRPGILREGVQTSFRWHAAFLVPSLITAGFGTFLVGPAAIRRAWRALLGALIGLIVPPLFTLVELAVLYHGGVVTTWYGIAVGFVMIFGMITGALIGALFPPVLRDDRGAPRRAGILHRQCLDSEDQNKK